MAGLRIVLAACAMALPLWLAYLTPAHACTGSMGPLEERVARSVVVIGRIRELRLIEPRPDVGSPVDGSPGEWLIDVEEYVVGSGPATLAIYEPLTINVQEPDGSYSLGSGAICHWFQAVGPRYLLFLTPRDDGRYDTGRWSGTRQLPDESDQFTLDEIAQIRSVAAEQIQTLPALGSAGHDAKRPLSRLPIAIAALTSAVLTSGALLLGRRSS